MTPDVRETERVEWRNVYREPSGAEFVGVFVFPSREELDAYNGKRDSGPVATNVHIAVERITITECVERFPVPEEGGR